MLFVEVAALWGGVEGDDGDLFVAADGEGGAEELFGEALSAGFGRDVEVQEVGAAGFVVHPVRREGHEVDAGAGENLSVGFEEEAEVGVVGEGGAKPGFEGLVHGVEAGFGGEVVVGEHAVAVLYDEGGVFYRGAAEGRDGTFGHRCSWYR